MDVDLTAEQRELASAAREFLAAECPPRRVRDAWDNGHDRRLWTQLAEVGFLGAVVPEHFGGLGRGDLELAVLLEEAGRVALPVPLLETSLAASTLAEAGSPDQQRRWLPGIAAGEVVASIVLPGHPLAAGGQDADLFVVATEGRIHAIDRERCEITPRQTVDGSRRLASVRARTGPDTLLPGTAARPERLADRAAVAAAATLVGIAAHLVATTVDYVTQRRQFGRPVGSFQAVKHRLADAHVATEFARPTVWVAAHLLATAQDEATEAITAAAVAKASATQAAYLAGEHALQCHGGIGFTWEHDLHLWLKRGKALENAYGTPTECRARVAAALFDTLATPARWRTA